MPRVAASSFLNTAPLIWSFTHGARRGQIQLIDAVPARCAELIEAGAADVALIPVIEYQRLQGVTLVPDVCVGSQKRVRSVVLVSRTKNLSEVKSVALDGSSRTSQALVKIIFREFLGIEPTWEAGSTNVNQMLDQHDAALIIGDPAMTFARQGLHVFDMAELWRTYTGLGFVFAMWVIRDSAPTSSFVVDFAAVRDEGLEAIDDIIQFYEPILKWPPQELRSYLTESITFSVNEQMREGMNLYFSLARKHALIPMVGPLKTVNA